MKSNIHYIDVEVINFIKENTELFRKTLYNDFDFISKGLTHWKLEITFPKDYLIYFTLKSQNRSQAWIVLNYGKDRGTSNLMLHRWDLKYKSLTPIMNETEDIDIIKDIYIKCVRDKKLKEILS